MQKTKLKQILKNHNGLNFNLIGNSNKNDVLFRTLENRGISDIARFSDPVPKVDFQPSQPTKQTLGIKLAKWFNGYIQNNKSKYVYILVDNDADGFTSAAFMYKYLTNFGITARFIFTPGKNHGIKHYSVKNKIGSLNRVGVLIIPDASLSLKDIDFLDQWHVPYLIIDHHDLNYQNVDKDLSHHIFNNQWEDTKINQQFTGVGMVYLFCKLLDRLNHTNYADKYLYFLSVGQVGDVSDISDPEIRYYVKKGFNQMVSSELLKLTTATDRLSAHELSFSIIPKINAVCRTGSLHDKNELIKAMVDDEPKDLIQISFRRKSHADNKFHKHYKKVSAYYAEAKKLDKIKAKQKRAVKKSLKALKDIYETKSFIVALDKTGSFQQEEAGLIATQLSSKYQKPTLVLRTCGKPGYYKGSARGNTKVMKDFRRFCNQTQKFVYALGHPSAFGVMISDSKLDDLLNEYKNVNLSDKGITYDVDNLYLDDVPSKKDIVAFDDNRDLFGGSVKEPSLGFVGLKADNIVTRGSLLLINAHGLKFIMFNCPSDIKRYVKYQSDKPKYGIPQSEPYLDIVGTPDINRFMKWHYPQIIINNIKITQPFNKSNNVSEDFDNFYF